MFKAGATLQRTRTRPPDGSRERQPARLGHHPGLARPSTSACRLLLVETEFEYPANLSEDGNTLIPYSGKGEAALDDAVDEVIEQVLADGGQVFFYDPGVLDLHQGIAAILRY